MPENVKITTDDIEPGSTAIISGRIRFARIVSQVAGKELEDMNRRRNDNGMFPIDSPHTRIQLNSVSILSPTAPNLSPLEQYISQHCYVTKDPQSSPGANYEAINKGNTLPAIGVRQPDGSYKQIYPTQDPTPGQECKVLIRVFPGKIHNGCTFEAVLFDQEPQFGPRNNLENDLAAHGITWTPTAKPAGETTNTAPAAIPATVTPTATLNQSMAPVAPFGAAPTTQANAQMAPTVAPLNQTAVPITNAPTAGIIFDPTTQS